MRHNSSKHKGQGNIPRPHHLVKGRVVAAGIRFGDLAGAASISRSSLSNYVNGNRCDWETQIRIWDAFRRLTGSDITLEEFWGELLSDKVRKAC